MKALVGALNQEKALVGAFSVIVKTSCGTDGSICGTNYYTLHAQHTSSHMAVFHPPGSMASPATEDTIKAPIEEENC